MAPEQIEGAAPTPAFDVYALGVLAFEVCTGKRPFEGPTAMAVAMERLARPAPLPSALRPELGVAWDEAIGRCLARDPARRFARVADVRNALQAPPPAIKRRSGARWLLAVAGLGGSALAVGLAPQRPASTVRPSSPAPAALSLATTAIAPSAPTTAALTSAPAPRARVLVAPVSSPTTPPPVRSAAPSRRPRAEPVVPRPLPTTVVAPAPATPAAPSSAPRPGHVDDVYNPFAKKP
jgi:serine/threonine-protein kinase